MGMSERDEAGKLKNPDAATAQRRNALFHLHKTLLESERAAYEKSIGQITSPYHFLHLLTHDAWFSWLQPFSQIIAGIDANLDGKSPPQGADLDALFKRVRVLLMPQEGDSGFSGHYHEAIQRDPDVLFAHVQAAQALRQN